VGKRHITLVIIVSFLTLITTTSPHIPVLNTNIAHATIPFEIDTTNASLSIETIDAGKGITLTITNTGETILSNLRVSASCTGGLRVHLIKPNATLPPLPTGETTTYALHLWGIGLGLLSDLPIVSITASSDQARDTIHVTLRLFGTSTKILSLVHDNQGYPGYILFSPEYSTKTYIMDKNGSILHTWQSQYIQGFGLSLLENGDLLRTAMPYPNPRFFSGGITGRVERYSWNGSLEWSYTYSDQTHCLHHDIVMLPSGNILMIAWEYKTMAEAIAAGRDPATLPYGELWPDHVIEVQPTSPTDGAIVWEWHLWDHIIQDFDPAMANYGTITDHPELLDINYGNDEGRQTADWNHVNAIDYNPVFDQILLSSHNQHEIWIIDHSTTTQEAAGHTGGSYGHGGDFLYRWGNPQTYDRGTNQDQQLFGQHDAQWIKSGFQGEGDIILFNNGEGRPDGQYSTIDEFTPPVMPYGNYTLVPESPYGPIQLSWRYQAKDPFGFFGRYLSGVQRLPNGTTLITDGNHGLIFEVGFDCKILWKYQNCFPDPIHNQIFYTVCYAPQYPGLSNLFQNIV
jgi:hypothetical protein